MNDPSASHRGALIREKRRLCSLTLTDLAQKTGLSISFLSQVETGVTNPSVNSLRKIALALGAPLSSFFEETSLEESTSAYTNEEAVEERKERGVQLNWYVKLKNMSVFYFFIILGVLDVLGIFRFKERIG